MEKYKLRSRWVKMLSRCEDEDYPKYSDYSGRGITVCEDWHHFEKFYNWDIEKALTTPLGNQHGRK